MSSQAAAPPVLQLSKLTGPRRIDMADLDPRAPGLTLHRIAHLTRPEERQNLREPLAVRSQPRLVGAEVQILHNDRTERFGRPGDDGLRHAPHRIGPGAQGDARRRGGAAVRRDVR